MPRPPRCRNHSPRRRRKRLECTYPLLPPSIGTDQHRILILLVLSDQILAGPMTKLYMLEIIGYPGMFLLGGIVSGTAMILTFAFDENNIFDYKAAY